MHIYHVASGTPVVAILRPAKTPKGSEVRTVMKHVTTAYPQALAEDKTWCGAATATTAATRR